MPNFHWLDADVLIDAHRGPYGFDIVPSFWKEIARNVKKDLIRSPIRVWTELEEGKDELFAWAVTLKASLFVAPDENVQKAYKVIADYVQTDYRQPYSGLFLKGADAWLIAHAQIDKGIVVTRESKIVADNKLGRVKIPNVCEKFGVVCCNTYDMMRKLKIQF